MFAAIARRYDLNNRLHSFGLDQSWRRAAVRAARPRDGDAVLDVACGTGDLTQAFARSAASRAVGLDFTPEMLGIARRKRAALAPPIAAKIEYVQGDAQALPFGDASFDIVSIAFGIRNVQDPARAIGEFVRVLRPAGRLVVLEFDTPSLAPVRWLNNLYSGRLMPRTAALIARDRSGAYRYLPRSISTFMGRAELCAMLSRAGLAEVSCRPLSLGICACTIGVKP